ncbi:MAG: YegS/Rv2252/BmrU family lipid kinase [Erysipelotrichaceae bacterium]|nr:YegS/Rv2252/BmrU family lipid kinase [Erysipelotrichaceae bacterium]
MKYYFIINPAAGPGISEKKIREELDQLDERIDCELFLTQKNQGATPLVKRIIENHPEEEMCFVACGGDGTINEVFEGCAHKDNVYASCIPSGSGNDFVKCFGTENFTIKKIIHGKKRKIDLIEVGDRHCVNVTNFGIDTAVVKNVNNNREKRGHGSSLDYPLGVLKAIFTSMRTKCTIIADGETVNPEGYALSVTFGNGRFVGGSYNCSPRASLDDGLIEVCIVKPISIIKFAQFIGPYSKGEHLDDEKISKHLYYRQAKEIEVIAEEGFEYSLDGEVIASTHFKCTIDPLALNFMEPETGE